MWIVHIWDPFGGFDPLPGGGVAGRKGVPRRLLDLVLILFGLRARFLLGVFSGRSPLLERRILRRD